MGAMPDVCLSSPSPPAGPIPVPYPNFSKASDTDEGARTVQIGGAEVGIKDKSTYKSSKSDEAATKSPSLGVVTHHIGNTMYFFRTSPSGPRARDELQRPFELDA
ncbi:hypothetical protein CBA19CS22_06490 [Caballeronia novacaledonica]|uniref:Uncharacterized protein n=1 Tax=Caballeronia novacaledonica TaxID=1544861 RepID=A0ACB5QN94_9BURK|nr:hypothetical protein CBA19CS22_06490 [Caballeronia novacaledonica]